MTFFVTISLPYSFDNLLPIPMIEWLDEHVGPITPITSNHITKGKGWQLRSIRPLRPRSDIEFYDFEFEHANHALLFKLTWA